MRLLLLAFGSRGDVQPLVPLAQGLQEAGYAVQIAAGSNFKDWITSKGIEFVDVGVDVHALMNTDMGKEWIENSSSSPMQEAQNMKRVFDEFTPLAGEEILRLGAQTDVIVSNLPTFGVAQTVADMLGKKHIRIMLAPMTPTNNPDATTVPMAPGRNSILNYWAAYIGFGFVYWINKNAINQFRRKHGQKPWGYGDFVRAWNQMPVLYGLSPLAMPRDPKWNDDTAVTGYWFEPMADWQPPMPLDNFLKKYEKPVYIGFGSMSIKNPKATMRIMVDALKASGEPGIIYSGWAGLHADDLPDNILLIDGAPHDWLFPRMGGVVHHGGAGTTAAGLRAGVPATIVPHMADQPYWGRRVYELGVGYKPIPRHELTTERLTEAIVAMKRDTQMQTKAAELGALIRQETGVANAVLAVNKMLEK